MPIEVKDYIIQHVMFKGIFDLDELYTSLKDWLEGRSFTLIEKKFKHKHPETGVEKEIIWTAYRRFNEMLMYWYTINMELWDVNPIDVVKDGQKKKLIKARIYVRVSQELTYDYQKRFKTPFQKFLLKFLWEFVYKRKVDSMWEDKLRFKAYDLMNIVKEVLDMQTKGNEHFDTW